MSRKYIGQRERRGEIMSAALRLAAESSYVTVTREAIASSAGCSNALVSAHCGTMQQLRRAIMGEAIRTRNLTVIAQGLSAKDPRAMGLDDELKREAVATLCD